MIEANTDTTPAKVFPGISLGDLIARMRSRDSKKERRGKGAGKIARPDVRG